MALASSLTGGRCLESGSSGPQVVSSKVTGAVGEAESNVLGTNSSEKRVTLFSAFLSLPISLKALAFKWLARPLPFCTDAGRAGMLGAWAFFLDPQQPGPGAWDAGRQGWGTWEKDRITGCWGEGGVAWAPHTISILVMVKCAGDGKTGQAGGIYRSPPPPPPNSVLCNLAEPHGLSCKCPPADALLSRGACLLQISKLANEWGPGSFSKARLLFLPIPTPPPSLLPEGGLSRKSSVSCNRNTDSKHGGGLGVTKNNSECPAGNTQSLPSSLPSPLSPSSFLLLLLHNRYSIRKNIWCVHPPERCKGQGEKDLKPSALFS